MRRYEAIARAGAAMTSPDMDDEAMKAMAERIGNEFATYDDTATGCAIATVVRKAALAAIIETRDRDAALVEAECGETVLGMHLVKSIRSGQQFRKDV